MTAWAKRYQRFVLNDFPENRYKLYIELLFNTCSLSEGDDQLFFMKVYRYLCWAFSQSNIVA